MSTIDRKRSLGLPTSASLRRRSPSGNRRSRNRPWTCCPQCRKRGCTDPDVDAGLAQLCFDLKTGDPLSFAGKRWRCGLAGQGRCDALLVAAQVQAERGISSEALAALHELTQLRRRASTGCCWRPVSGPWATNTPRRRRWSPPSASTPAGGPCIGTWRTTSASRGTRSGPPGISSEPCRDGTTVDTRSPAGL